MSLFLKILKWSAISIAVAFAALVVYRMFYLWNEEKTREQVARIHSTKLTLDDVMGKNLPPPPGDDADKTIAGIDANHNNIRDDVELAIFKEYPDSAKTRAVLLQYALASQMEVVQTIVSEGTVTEVATEQGRADTCVADTLVPRKSPESSRVYSDIEKIDGFINFVENKQFNTDARKKSHHDFYENKLGSYGDSTNDMCDIDSSTLPN